MGRAPWSGPSRKLPPPPAGDTAWAMSEENVELYRRGIEAFNSRDLDAFLALADPDVVGISQSSRLRATPASRARPVPREWWTDLLGVFPDFRIEVVWVRDAGDLTVSELRNSAHGEGSAAPLEEFVWQVSEWRDGRVVRWQMYEEEPGRPRSRRTAGVGDVGGERRDRASRQIEGVFQAGEWSVAIPALCSMLRPCSLPMPSG